MRLRLAPLAVSLLLAASACSDGTGAEEGIHGTYTLRTINASVLPFTLRDNVVERIEVTGGSITLKLDGSFRDEMNYRITPAGGAPGTEAELFTGTFIHTTTTLDFMPDPSQGGPYSATIQIGGALQQFVGTYTLIYQR